MMQVTQAPVVVIGNGWSALAALGYLRASGASIRWILGTGAHLIAPLPSLEVGEGLNSWSQLLKQMSIEAGEPSRGSYLREFRNKAFREPLWSKAPTPQARREVRDELLWAPETRFVGCFEALFELPLAEIEFALREKFLHDEAIQRTSDVPVIGIKTHPQEQKITGVILGSGEEVLAERVIYADRWSEPIQGLPRQIPFHRNRVPVGVLQAVFIHERLIQDYSDLCFYGPMNRDAGEEDPRNIWGYFFEKGKKSVWTLFLSPDEVEDNHFIAKKLRRLKQTLDRMFPDLLSTVQDEQVRFEESFVFSKGDPLVEPQRLPKLRGLDFVTDGYGPAFALQQVSALFKALAGARVENELEACARSPR